MFSAGEFIRFYDNRLKTHRKESKLHKELLYIHDIAHHSCISQCRRPEHITILFPFFEIVTTKCIPIRSVQLNSSEGNAWPIHLCSMPPSARVQYCLSFFNGHCNALCLSEQGKSVIIGIKYIYQRFLGVFRVEI